MGEGRVGVNGTLPSREGETAYLGMGRFRRY